MLRGLVPTEGIATVPSDRLTSGDLSFLSLETRTTPQHIGELAIFPASPDGLTYPNLVRVLQERIASVPRYRQKVRQMPAHLANPVWIDDPNFDITYHVRRSALPRPGGDAELLEFCARIQSRQLDRHRPLWELYFVEGLTGDRVAIITKTHQSMIDGRGAVDIADVLMDARPHPGPSDEPLWMPEPEPSSAHLVGNALWHMVRRPTTALEPIRLGVNDLRAVAGRMTSAVDSAVSVTKALTRHSSPSPLATTVGEQRRIGIARTSLADYRTVRQAHRVTVNDVALATVCGALRSWLLHRGIELQPTARLRALVPVSVADDDDRHGAGLSSVGRVTGLLADLPIGEPDPVRRLRLTSQTTAAHRRSGRAVDADALVSLTGFAPPTLHALGVRVAHGLARRTFDLMVTNVPGPQTPRYVAGSRKAEVFPVIPLTAGSALAIGITSYDGGMYYGLNADRDALPDVGALAGFVEETLAELVESSPAPRDERPVSLSAARATHPPRPPHRSREPHR
jgi:diacylglycerol O-acyltransferase